MMKNEQNSSPDWLQPLSYHFPAAAYLCVSCCRVRVSFYHRVQEVEKQGDTSETVKTGLIKRPQERWRE